MVRIKGSVLRSRLAMVDEIAPNGGLDRVLARMSSGDRETLASPLASSWYPFEVGRNLDAAIVDELGAGRPEFFESSAPDCATVVGWYRRALEMCGVEHPRVVEQECRAKGGNVCRNRLTWS